MLQFIKKQAKFYYLCLILFCIAALLAACASQKAAKSSAAGENKLITDIVTSEDAQSATVTVKGNQKLNYRAVKQVFPLGVLFHFPGTSLDSIATVTYPPENDFISSIRASQVDEDGGSSRVFVALKKDLPYKLESDGGGLKIIFPKSGKLANLTPAPKTPAPQTPAPQTPAPRVKAESTPAPALTPSKPPKTKVPAVKSMPQPAMPAKGPVSPATRITSVSATPLNEKVVITVKADGTIADYKTFTISETPPRIVYDLYKLKSPFKEEQKIAVKSDQVRKIRHFGHPDKIRIVLETQKPYLSKYSARSVDNGLLIYVGVPPRPERQEKPLATVNPHDAKPMVASAAKPETAENLPIAKPGKQGWLNRIDFAMEDAGKSVIVVGTTRPVEYRIVKVDQKKLQLKLLNTNLPEYSKRALITTRFQSAVDRITPNYKPQTKDTVIDIELREGVPYFVKQSDDTIRINFSASKIPPKPYEDAKPPAWINVMEEPTAESGVKKSATAAAAATPQPQTASEKASLLAEATPPAGQPIKPPVVKDQFKPAKKEKSIAERLDSMAPPNEKYTGEKIALDFYDTDIKNVFRIIREISGKNFAIDKGVTGKVTLSLDKPVPWDQVLELVLKMNQLGMTMEGDIIRIATLNSLAQEEKLKQAQLKATQQAVKQKKALEPLVTAYIPVSYSNAQSEVLPHIQTVLTEGRGKASVDTRNNQLILTDTAEKIEQMREIVMKIDQVTPQVVIEARIVEANTSFTRDLGFDWGQVTAGPFEWGDADITLRGAASNLPAADPSALVGFDFIKLSGTPFTIIDAKLLVSETEGKTNIISAPKVVTLDNKKAKIKQGLEVPYLERDSSGNATVRFKNVDLLLEVTPNVTPDERIVMKIFVTKNDIAEQTQDGPALATNEAETELLIEDGDTIVIGGIVKSAITYAEKGIPGLGRIGVLGWLFKSQSKKDQKNELLIFITPRIVQLKQKEGVEI